MPPPPPPIAVVLVLDALADADAASGCFLTLAFVGFFCWFCNLFDRLHRPHAQKRARVAPFPDGKPLSRGVVEMLLVLERNAVLTETHETDSAHMVAQILMTHSVPFLTARKYRAQDARLSSLDAHRGGRSPNISLMRTKSTDGSVRFPSRGHRRTPSDTTSLRPPSAHT